MYQVNCINIPIYKSNNKTCSFLKIYKMQRNNFNLRVHRTPAQDHFTDTYAKIFTFKLQTIFHRCSQTPIK